MKKVRSDLVSVYFKTIVAPCLVATVLFGSMFMLQDMEGLGGKDKGAGSSDSLSSIVNAQLQDVTNVSLEAIPVETSTEENSTSSVLGMSTVSSSCGGAAIPVAAQICSKNSEDVNLPTEIARGPETVRMKNDAEVVITEIRLPQYWKGIDADGDYFIDVLLEGDIPDISKIIGSGGIIGAKTRDDGKIAHSAEGHHFSRSGFAPGPEFFDIGNLGGAATEFRTEVTFPSDPSSSAEDRPASSLDPGESVKTATPICEPASGKKAKPTGCANPRFSATEAMNEKECDKNKVPISSDDPMVRLNLEEQDCIVPAAVVPGCITCINMMAKTTGWFVRAVKAFSISPEGIVECIVHGNCTKDVQFYLWMDNILGDNWAAVSKSNNMAMDFICSSLHEPDHFGLYQSPNDLPIGANLPFCPDRYVATDCKVSVDGKEAGAWCMFPAYEQLVFDHAETTSNLCIIEPKAKYCDKEPENEDVNEGFERYANHVYNYKYYGDDENPVCN